MDPLLVVTFKWHRENLEFVPGHKRVFYTSEYVNKLKSMLGRHLRMSHRLMCITDDTDGMDAGIEHYPLWGWGSDLRGCYRRLKLFDDLGFGRFAMMDLDVVLTSDVTHLFDREEDFIIMGTADRTPQRYNGGFYLMDSGCRRRVWDDFDVVYAEEETKNRGLIGSDQAWIQIALGPDEARFLPGDGATQAHLLPRGGKAPMTFFAGSRDLSYQDMRKRFPWIQDHWC